jgi:hypothetical protein
MPRSCDAANDSGATDYCQQPLHAQASSRFRALVPFEIKSYEQSAMSLTAMAVAAFCGPLWRLQ